MLLAIDVKVIDCCTCAILLEVLLFENMLDFRLACSGGGYEPEPSASEGTRLRSMFLADTTDSKFLSDKSCRFFRMKHLSSFLSRSVPPWQISFSSDVGAPEHDQQCGDVCVFCEVLMKLQQLYSTANTAVRSPMSGRANA